MHANLYVSSLGLRAALEQRNKDGYKKIALKSQFF